MMGNTQKKLTRDPDSGTEKIPKEQKGGNPQGDSNPNTWNSLLNAILTSLIEVAGRPSFSALIKYCRKTAEKSTR